MQNDSVSFGGHRNKKKTLSETSEEIKKKTKVFLEKKKIKQIERGVTGEVEKTFAKYHSDAATVKTEKQKAKASKQQWKDGN